MKHFRIGSEVMDHGPIGPMRRLPSKAESEMQIIDPLADTWEVIVPTAFLRVDQTNMVMRIWIRIAPRKFRPYFSKRSANLQMPSYCC